MTARTIILVFVWEFVVLLSFVIFNTMLIGEIVPLFDGVANDIPNFDIDRYDSHANQLVSVFYVVFFIMIVLPIVYLAMWLFFRREPGAGREVFENGINV